MDDPTYFFKVHLTHIIPSISHVNMPRGKSISDIKQGFWINDDGKFTYGEDSKYWIPISQIVFVEKVKINED